MVRRIETEKLVCDKPGDEPLALLRMVIGNRSDALFLSAKDKATWLIEELKNSKSTDKKFN